MPEFLFGAAFFILGTIAIGLVRILYSRQAADCMMAAQLIGTGGVAMLLLLAVALDAPPIVDVALMLALLAAFASIAFVGGLQGRSSAQVEDHPQ